MSLLATVEIRLVIVDRNTVRKIVNLKRMEEVVC